MTETLPASFFATVEQELGNYQNCCFCCGVCCTRYQVQLSLEEAQRIVAQLGVTWQEWLSKYVDPNWPGVDNFLLRQYHGACVFLGCEKGGRMSRCLIHSFKPLVCRQWPAGLLRKECQEGLFRFWGLWVDSSGQLKGPKQRLRVFYSFWGFPRRVAGMI